MQVALPPGTKLVMQLVAPTAVKLEGTVSLTVKLVLGASPVKLSMSVTVVPGAPPPLSVSEPPPGLSENTKLPLPPSTCLVTTIWPRAALVKAQSVFLWPAPPAAIQLGEPAGAKLAFAASVTV